MGGKSTTSTTTNTPPPEVMAAYKDLLARANPVANTPYQPYMGGVNGTGMEQNQVSGFNNIANLAGSSNGAFSNASGALGAAGVPTSASVGQYMSPYIQGVVNATMGNMAEQNGQQQQGVLGNAIAQGAMGGNRVGVAQSELARQQNLANQQTIVGLYNGAYNNALGAAQADKQANLQAASEYGNLGQTQMQTNLGQAAAQVGAGTQQQAWNYQQFQNQRSYPFQQTSWLANIVEGLGAGMGGTSSTTQPAGNTGSAVLGGLLGLGSLFLNRGGVVSEDRLRRATGGVIPYSGPSGIVPMNDNTQPAANDNGYVPAAATGTLGRSTMPTSSGIAPQQSTDPMLQQGMRGMEGALKQKYPNGVLAGINSVALPQAAPIPTPNPMTGEAGLPPKIGDVAASASTGLPGLASLFGFADGGVARKHYDDGGAVGDDPLLDNIRAFLGGSTAPAAPTALSDQQFNDRAGGNSEVPFPGVVSPAIAADFGDHGPVPQPLSDDQRAVATARNEANAQNFGDNTGVAQPSNNAGVVPALPSRTIADAPVAPSVPEYHPERVSKYSPAFDKINDAAGLPPGYLNQTAYIESGFNPAADNGIARGAFQFTGPTAKQYGLTDPFDPIASAQAAARLASDNSKFLAGGLGRAPTAGELYLAHQQGASGALNLLTHPGANAADIVGRAAVVQNGGSPDMTAAQFANLWTSRFNPVSSNSSTDSTVNRMADNNSAPDGITTGSTGVVASGQDDPRGIISSIFHGERPNISNDMRMALLSAGLGMMAGTSPNFATNVGTGGQKGLETWMAKQQLNRENAQAASEIATRSGQLGLEGKRVDIAGQQLALEAKKNAADIAQTTANTARTGVETAGERYQTQYTPAGLMVRDVTRPDLPPHIISYNDLQNGALMPDGSPVPAPGATTPAPAGAAPAAAAPATQPQTAPVVAAPVKPVGPVPVGAQPAPSSQSSPIFTTEAPSRIPIDPRMMQPAGGVGPSTVVPETTDALKQARTNYQAATTMQTQLGEMQHDLAALPASAMTKQGSGFNSRVQIAKTINTALQMANIQPWFDEKAVAAGEDLNKQTTRLGFNLSSTLGSGEAASIVEKSVASVPGGANSPEGARRIIAGIQAGNQRSMDYYQFLQDWAGKSGGSIRGADQYFNERNPPELYAIASYVPAGAIQALRQHPDQAANFEQKYGAGTSKYVLSGQ